MTVEPVGMEAVLELLNPVLAFSTLVVKAKGLGTAAGTVADQEAKIGTGGGVLGFGDDAVEAKCGRDGGSW